MDEQLPWSFTCQEVGIVSWSIRYCVMPLYKKGGSNSNQLKLPLAPIHKHGIRENVTNASFMNTRKPSLNWSLEVAFAN